MAAINVILTAEQCGRLVQQGGRDGGEVFRQAINLLVQVRLHQVKDAAFSELIRLGGHSVLHKPVGIQIPTPSGVFRQRRLQRQNAAEAVGALLQTGVTEYQVVLHKPAECLLAQQRVRDKGAGQNVTFDCNRGAMMHGGAVGARQSVKTHRWLIPAIHLHAFYIIQQFPAVQHRDRVAKAECFCRCRAAALFSRSVVFIHLAHQKISTMLLVLAASPCSGSLNSACIVAQARSAWLASSLRLAS